VYVPGGCTPSIPRSEKGWAKITLLRLVRWVMALLLRKYGVRADIAALARCPALGNELY
jgi:hypothetical protein